MTVDRGLLALLEAKPGKGDELAAFLKQGRELAVAESGTVTWYAFKLSDTTYGIFDTFENEDARQAHLNGQIPAALGKARPGAARERPRHPHHRHHRAEVTAAENHAAGTSDKSIRCVLCKSRVMHINIHRYRGPDLHRPLVQVLRACTR